MSGDGNVRGLLTFDWNSTENARKEENADYGVLIIINFNRTVKLRCSFVEEFESIVTQFRELFNGSRKRLKQFPSLCITSNSQRWKISRVSSTRSASLTWDNNLNSQSFFLHSFLAFVYLSHLFFCVAQVNSISSYGCAKKSLSTVKTLFLGKINCNGKSLSKPNNVRSNVFFIVYLS